MVSSYVCRPALKIGISSSQLFPYSFMAYSFRSTLSSHFISASPALQKMSSMFSSVPLRLLIPSAAKAPIVSLLVSLPIAVISFFLALMIVSASVSIWYAVCCILHSCSGVISYISASVASSSAHCPPFSVAPTIARPILYAAFAAVSRAPVILSIPLVTFCQPIPAPMFASSSFMDPTPVSASSADCPTLCSSVRIRSSSVWLA